MIKKCAAIIIHDEKLLVVKKHNTSMYISPGGKQEDGEEPLECLSREIFEELGVKVINSIHFSIDYAKSAFENEEIEINTWLIEISGVPKACAEISDIKWINYEDSKNLRIGSIFKEKIIPKLKLLHLIK